MGEGKGRGQSKGVKEVRGSTGDSWYVRICVRDRKINSQNVSTAEL